MIEFLLHFLSLVIYIYIAGGTIYLLIFAIAGKWINGTWYKQNPVKKTIAVFIPAYREDAIIIDTLKKAMDHNYPKEFFKVIVIADELQEQTLDTMRSIGGEVLEVHFDVSMKAKSIHAALQTLQSSRFNIIVVLDADNVMEVNCLEKINAAFHNGCKAVQCHRIAKNLNKPISILEAISEEININLFRRGPAALGLSAAPLGSGMAFQSDLLKEIYSHNQILHNPAEDRETDIQLLRRNIRIYYLDDAYVYDEKVATSRVFENQRIRWLEAQVHNLRRFFHRDMKDAPKTAHYYNRVIQNLLLPRLLYLVLFCVIVVILIFQWLFKVKLFYPPDGWWLAWMLAYCFVLIISIPTKFFNLKTLKAVIYIPVLMISMLKAVIKMKRNRKEFLHTSKTFTTK